MFGIFNGNFLFIIDLSSKKIMKKIKINEEMKIINLSYVNRNGNEYLYMTIYVYGREHGVGGSKIIHGILL